MERTLQWILIRQHCMIPQCILMLNYNETLVGTMHFLNIFHKNLLSPINKIYQSDWPLQNFESIWLKAVFFSEINGTEQMQSRAGRDYFVICLIANLSPCSINTFLFDKVFLYAIFGWNLVQFIASFYYFLLYFPLSTLVVQLRIQFINIITFGTYYHSFS